MPSAQPPNARRLLADHPSPGMGANPLPAASAPRPPKGFVPHPAYELLGQHARSTEVSLAPDVIKELERFVAYEAVFGSLVPTRKRVTSVLEFAIKWRTERAAAAAWDVYCRSQDAGAWATALDLLGDLKPAFLLALKQDPSIGKECPRLAMFFAARKEIAKRANATKSKKKAAALVATSENGSSEAATTVATSAKPARKSRSARRRRRSPE